MLRIENINMRVKAEKSGFFMPAKREQILNKISVEFPPGKQTWLLGESGAGKSVLFRILSFQERDFQGAVFADGKQVGTKLSVKEAKKTVSLIAQDQHIWLKKNMTLRNFVNTQNDNTVSDDEISQGFRKFGLDNIEADRTCGSLSGGQSQILVILAALFRSTPVILGDNPLSSLDPTLKNLALKKFSRLSEQHQNTVILCSNDLTAAQKYADFILLLKAGEIAEFSPAKDFFTNPDSEYGREFLQSVCSSPVPFPLR